MANLITPEMTVAASSLFAARAPRDNPNGRKTFYLRGLFTPEAMQSPQFKAIEARLQEIGKEKFGAKFPAMWREGAVKSPFRPQVESKGYPERFACFINMSTGEAFKPNVYDEKGNIITDPSKVYPGCVVRASVSLRAYGGPGTTFSAGISIDLRNVLWLRDGEKLAGGQSDGRGDFNLPLPEEANDDLNSLVAA